MKILAVGDPHGNMKRLGKVPKKGVDMVLVTGDLGKVDLARKRFFDNVKRKEKGLPELDYDSKFMKKVHMEVYNSTINVLEFLSKIAKVYTLQGDVRISTKSRVKAMYKEYGLKLPSTMERIKKMKKVKLVKNMVRRVNGLRIGFLEVYDDVQWVKDFKPSNYRERMSDAKKETAKVKRILQRFGKLDILVSHQPPYGYLDKVSGKYGAPKKWQGKHAGGKAILDYIKKYQPKYVFCGHIHEGEGKAVIGKTKVFNLGFAGHILIELDANA